MRTYLLLFSITLFISFVACRKRTIEVSVPVVHSWSTDTFVTGYNKILVTSLPLNDSTLAVANRFTVWYINARKPNSTLYGYLIPGISTLYSITYPPSITKHITVSVGDPNNLDINLTYNPGTPFGLAQFKPTYTSSTTSIKGLSFGLVVPRSVYPIINAKYLLAPTEIDFTAQKAFASLIRLDTTQPIAGTPAVSISSVKNIQLDPAPITLGFSFGGYFSAAYYGKFFLHYYNQFFRIDTTGQVKSFGYSPGGNTSGQVSDMFTINNYLFAMGSGKFFASTDQGETWSLFLDASGSIYGSLHYMNVGNDLYATTGSQIVRVTMTGNTFNFQELDNDGLNTNEITSINKCGKYVYATTLSGLYYRDTATFNTPKP